MKKIFNHLIDNYEWYYLSVLLVMLVFLMFCLGVLTAKTI